MQVTTLIWSDKVKPYTRILVQIRGKMVGDKRLHAIESKLLICIEKILYRQGFRCSYRFWLRCSCGCDFPSHASKYDRFIPSNIPKTLGLNAIKSHEIMPLLCGYLCTFYAFCGITIDIKQATWCAMQTPLFHPPIPVTIRGCDHVTLKHFACIL